MTLAEVQRFFADEFPQSSVTIEAVGDRSARVRQEIDTRHLRPGSTVAGPVMMAVADSAMYAALLAEIGPVALAVTTNLSIAFMRRPRANAAIVGECRLLKIGERLAVGDVKIYSTGIEEPVAQATLTYSIPPR